MFPAFSQTYQELSERAVAAIDKTACHWPKTQQALKMEPANPQHNALLFSNLNDTTSAAPV